MFRKEKCREGATPNSNRNDSQMAGPLGTGRPFRRGALSKGFFLVFLTHSTQWPPQLPLVALTPLATLSSHQSSFNSVTCQSLFPLSGLFTCCSVCLGCAYPCSSHILLLLVLQVSAQISHLKGAFPDGPVLIMSPFMILTTLTSHFIFLFSYLLSINGLYYLKQPLWSPEYYHHY